MTREKPRRRVFLSPPHLGGEEMEFVRQAFESNYIAPLGPMVDAFEREVCERTGHTHAAAVVSGTAALHLALRILGVGPEDEVLVSDLTFIGGVSPVTFLGARPVFVDCSPDTWNMDPGLVAEELARCAARGKLPAAVVPTDIYGQPADLDALLEATEPYGVPVVVDSAEALGATYKGRATGKGARAAVYSFNGNKIITTSGGGMLVSDDAELVAQARFLAQQARDPGDHYEHSVIGYNYRMSNLLAAVGRGQLKVLETRVRQKRAIFEHFRAGLEGAPGLSFMPEAPYARATRWLTVLLVEPEAFGAGPADILAALGAAGYEGRPVWKPMHLQPVFGGTPTPGREPPRVVPARAVGGAVAEDLFARGVCLPSGTAMEPEDLDRIVDIVLNCGR